MGRSEAGDVRCGVFVPNLGPFGDVHLLVELARAAESAGWDGFFIWDTVLGDLRSPLPVVDPWVTLAAVAVGTTRVRIGALVTPLARRRPWKVARETVTLDRLSGGRLVFGAGLGGPPDVEFQAFGEDPDARVRAVRLDRALELLDRLWSGEPLSISNDPDALSIPGFRPTPTQRPRPPVWVAGWWPAKPPFRRAARWDGVFPQLVDGATPSPSQVREVIAYISDRRASLEGFDVVVSGASPADRAGAWERVEPYASVGATWWLEEASPDADPSLHQLRERIAAGPPRRPSPAAPR